MRRLKKAMSVLMVTALLVVTALRPEMPVLAEEAADTQTAAETETQETMESSEKEEASADEVTQEENEQEDEEVPDPSEEESQGDVENPDEEQQDSETPDGEEEESKEPDEENPEEMPEEQPDGSEDDEETDDPEAENPEGDGETQDEKTEDEKSEDPEETEEQDLEIIKGVQLTLQEYSEEELAALSLSTILKHLQDGDGNFLDIAEDAATVWIQIKDSAGNLVFDGQYDRTSEEVLDLSQYVNSEGYTMEVTVGTGEREDPGNTRYIAKMNLEVKLTSLLPLEEVYAYLILNGYSKEELAAMPLSTVLNNLQDAQGNKIQLPEGATTVWSYYKDEYGSILKDEYHAIENDETVDLTTFWYRTSYSMELIIGSGEQLNPGNVRYIVEVYVSDEVEDYISFRLYAQDGSGTRTPVTPIRQETYTANQNYQTEERGFDVTKFVVPSGSGNNKYFLTMSSSAARQAFWDVDVYDYAGYLSLQSGNQGAAAITDQVLDSGTGYEGNFVSPEGTFDSDRNLFVLVYRNPETGTVVGTKSVGFVVVEDSYSISGSLYAYENGQMVKATSYEYSGSSDTKVNFESGSMTSEKHCGFTLKSGYYLTGEYYLTLDVESLVAGNADSSVVKAVKGYYDSLEAAADKKDIKKKLVLSDGSQLPSGYKVDFSKNSTIDFTLFMENGSVFKLFVSASGEMSAEESKAPVVGRIDPWFRITSAKQGDENLDIYVVQNGGSHDLDTLYGYGYQTVFVNTDADLTKVKINYWLRDEDGGINRVYYSTPQGTLPVSRNETEIDFSQGPVQFIVAIGEGENYQKNYVVEFKKRNSGSNLYVYGPRTREIFLDEYFEYKHDILIANLGDEPLTGLKVDLEATNCELDDYWTVGGENNQTLAPFTTTQREESHGELPNMAKITLRPKVDEYDKDGKITGKLTISADGQEPVVIELTGMAQNPKITTTGMYDGVKYVPYSCIIATNNMHDWLDVTFDMKGDLPAGVQWYPDTAEIYGVPQETGEFPIEVTAKFTSASYSFKPSTVNLTLTVLDNTNGNVYAASDEGYTILDSIGEDVGDLDFLVTEIKDDVFRSSGELGEFVDLWLNGQKLTEGVDYTAESGSTRITLFSQTFENKVDRTGRNTLAAEFRVAGERTNELKRTAQNFRVDVNATVAPKPTVTETPAATPTPQPVATQAPAATQTPRPTAVPQATQTPVPTVEINYVNCAVRVTDGDGNPLTTRSLEMHSDPVSSTTDVNGLAGFGHVEFGDHTVYIKDNDGNIEASKAFRLEKGGELTKVNDTIVARAGSSITIEMKYANGTLSIESVQDGITSRISPATGDTSRPELWILLLVVSLGAIIVFSVRRVRR